MGWLLIIGGVGWYFLWSFIGYSVYVRKYGHGTPLPGTGDVPGWVSGLALFGGIGLIIAGIANLVGG